MESRRTRTRPSAARQGAAYRGIRQGLALHGAAGCVAAHLPVRARRRATRTLAMRGQMELGQATVEAAFIIPVLLVGLLLLIQPGILLYDRIVMNGAASEACRLLATRTNAAGDMAESCEVFVRHRLGAVPPVACFHVHEGGCSWKTTFEGDEGSGTVSVTVSTEARPLPLLGAGGKLLGLLNGNGNFVVEATARQTTQPAWVDGVEAGRDPAGWTGAWLP